MLAVGLDEDGFAGSVEAMPAGPAVIQVLVTDGFHTAVGEWVRVDVPWRAPSVAILWPRRDAPVDAGVALRLWAVATASDGRALDGEDVQWELDGERVAVGADQWVMAELSDGEHRAVLHADDGQSSSDTEVVFQVRGRDG